MDARSVRARYLGRRGPSESRRFRVVFCPDDHKLRPPAPAWDVGTLFTPEDVFYGMADSAFNTGTVLEAPDGTLYIVFPDLDGGYVLREAVAEVVKRGMVMEPCYLLREGGKTLGRNGTTQKLERID